MVLGIIIIITILIIISIILLHTPFSDDVTVAVAVARAQLCYPFRITSYYYYSGLISSRDPILSYLSLLADLIPCTIRCASSSSCQK